MTISTFLRRTGRLFRPVVDRLTPLYYRWLRFSRRRAFTPTLTPDIAFYRYPDPTVPLPPAPPAERVNQVILMIGDGLGPGIVHLAALAGGDPDARLHMELLPVLGSLRTHSHHDVGTDSAAAATALASGHKTLRGTLGVLPDGQPVKNALEAARELGWRTGVVVSGNPADATPAAFMTHYPYRAHKDDIALRICENPPDILYGCGYNNWRPDTRVDGVDPLAPLRDRGYVIAGNLREAAGPRVVGMFPRRHRTITLAAMVKSALDRLSAASEPPSPGFFLMAEGTLIDKFAHRDDFAGIIEETLRFDEAVREATAYAAAAPGTLVLVTADHASGGAVLWRGAAGPEGAARVDWAGFGHSPIPVPLYAYGAGAERFAGVMDNTEVIRRVAALTGLPLDFA